MPTILNVAPTVIKMAGMLMMMLSKGRRIKRNECWWWSEIKCREKGRGDKVMVMNYRQRWWLWPLWRDVVGREWMEWLVEFSLHIHSFNVSYFLLDGNDKYEVWIDNRHFWIQLLLCMYVPKTPHHLYTHHTIYDAYWHWQHWVPEIKMPRAPLDF